MLHARYIHTHLSAITRAIFHPDDDKILDYLDDGGIAVEPRHYVPIVPMVLVNGAEGMGTGWSTNVPCHDARDVVDNIKRLLRGEEPQEMSPWYRGFKVGKCRSVSSSLQRGGLTSFRGGSN